MRVMTFNVLHDAVRNLAAPWVARRGAVAKTIRSADPDVACLQEVSPRQLESLIEILPEYDFIPGIPTGPTRVPRWASGIVVLARPVLGDYVDRGELCPVLVRKGRLSSIEHGSARLSFTQEDLGPAWNDFPTPHVVTWARFEDASGRRFTVHNTHLGILPWNWARTARELLAILGRDWKGEPQILAGDFNTVPWGPLVRLLREGGDDPSKGFHDAWLEAGKREGRGWTFHWGVGWSGPRLDYIMVRPQPKVERAMTLGSRTEKVFPSDHFAVVADLELRVS